MESLECTDIEDRANEKMDGESRFSLEQTLEESVRVELVEDLESVLNMESVWLSKVDRLEDRLATVLRRSLLEVELKFLYMGAAGQIAAKSISFNTKAKTTSAQQLTQNNFFFYALPQWAHLCHLPNLPHRLPDTWKHRKNFIVLAQSQVRS